MDCQAVQQNEVIEGYLRHRLDEALSDEFETHLLGCSDCTWVLEYMQSLRDGLEERALSICTPESKQQGFLWRWRAKASLFGREVRSRLRVRRKGSNAEETRIPGEEEPVPPPIAPAKSGRANLEFEDCDHQLNPRYTFDTFVVGKSNEFAHHAALAVAEQPSKAHNPLFLYGGVGMGKTHLMHAIGHTIKKRDPAMRLSYVSAKKFTIEVVNSPQISFRERFHTLDVLLVDDIQFIAGEEAREEFFHTFNALYEQQKQIVISSDCLPKALNLIEERLRSRFQWGLIEPPDLETKIAILQKKAENERFSLPDDVAEHLARAINSNVRELEGALTRLMAYALLPGVTISLATARQVLRSIIASQQKRVATPWILEHVHRIQEPQRDRFWERYLKIGRNTRKPAEPGPNETPP
jgi:chromosomal replication initiator protein DnaA